MNIGWYVNRLRAMSVREILWRIDQKKLANSERGTFGKQQMQVTDGVFYQGKEDLAFHVRRLPIADASESVRICEREAENVVSGGADGGSVEKTKRTIPLLGGYSYEKYKKDWHAGFQTENQWPLTFSYDLSYKQKDEIGDARTNWELNRHFQFALLACNYYRSGEQKYLTELSDLFWDWNEQNPFLYGISWTSVMEIAIRDMNWIYTLGFLVCAAEKTGADVRGGKAGGATGERGEVREGSLAGLCDALFTGIINMTSYISEHYSRYSSANNHVIVEAAAMGIAGIVTECGEWYETAFSILQHEIGRQNYKDGVNKEASLHYQAFFMEAVGLLMLTMQTNGIQTPQSWRNMLCRMSRYVADCRGNYGETVVFGDDDGGRILDLGGAVSAGEPISAGEETGRHARDHYGYVLQLMSVVLPQRYAETVDDPTLRRIIPEETIETLMRKPYYKSGGSVCYEEGGVSLLKSNDGRALIGIDHGALGFGSIAAHGHADALSFQLYLEGEAVFADAGTYIYHIDLENRNAFRRTENHNVITVNERDQSEMLGAFLWGKRAQTTLLSHNMPVGNAWDSAGNGEKSKESSAGLGKLYVEAEHDGYAPVIHRRKFEFDGKGCLKIYDSLLHVEKEMPYQLNFLLGEGCGITETALGVYEIVTEKKRHIRMRIEAHLITTVVRDAWLSTEYGIKKPTKQIRAEGKTEKELEIVTTIEWE